MNIVNLLHALHPLDGVQLSLTVTVTAEAFETLTTLGTEGIFYPVPGWRHCRRRRFIAD